MSRQDIYRDILANPAEAYAKHHPYDGNIASALATAPKNLHVGIVAYALLGTPTGGFLRAALANDFLRAASRADDVCRHFLFEIARVIYALPGGCHGSEEKVSDWIKSGGLIGIAGEEDAA